MGLGFEKMGGLQHIVSVCMAHCSMHRPSVAPPPSVEEFFPGWCDGRWYGQRGWNCGGSIEFSRSD